MKEEVFDLIYIEFIERKRFLIYHSDLDIKATDLTPKALEAMGGPDEVAIGLHPITGVLVPYFITDTYRENMHELSNWYALVTEHRDQLEGVVPGLVAQMAASGITISEEESRKVVYTPVEARTPDMLNGLDRELLKYTNMDGNVTRKLQGCILVDDVQYPHHNINHINIVSPDQQVGFALPKREVIMTHVEGEDYQITFYASLFNVYPDSPFRNYPNRIYQYKHIEKILNITDPRSRASAVKEAMDYIEKSVEIPLKADEKRAMRDFEAIPLKHVIGDSENDQVELMENEIPFYENLIAFIKYHIELEHKRVMAGAPEEEIKAKAEADFKAGNLPKNLREYLTQLLESITKTGFHHTGNFDIFVGEDLSDSDEEDGVVVSSTRSDNLDEKEFGKLSTKRNERDPDLHIRITDYLIECGHTHSATVWAEAILKLMRWGDRKIQNLHVGERNTKYLDLRTMEIITDELADLTGFEVSTDEEGRSLEIIGACPIDFLPEGSRRAKSYPFVLFGREFGYLPGSDEEIKVNYVTTLFDVVKSYTEGKANLMDISFNGDRFVQDYPDTPLNAFELDIAQLVGKRLQHTISDELTDYAIDNAITDLKSIAFAFLNAGELEAFKTTEPLVQKLATTPKAMRHMILSGGFLGAFQAGAEDYEDQAETMDLAELLTWYYKEIYPAHLEAYNKLLGLSESKKLNAINLQAAHFFTSPEGDTQEEESGKFMYKVYEGPALQFAPVIFNPKVPKVVMGVTRLPDGNYVFAAPDEITSQAVNAQTLTFGNVFSKMWEAMISADPGNDLDFGHHVMSEDTVTKIYKAVKGM